MFSSLLSAAYAVERFEPIALWTSVGLLGLLSLVGFVLFFAKRTALPVYAKYALYGFVIYLFALGVAFFSLEIAKKYSESYTEENYLDRIRLIRFVFLPLLLLTAVLFLSLSTYGVCSVFALKAKKWIGVSLLGLCGIVAAASLVCIGVYYHQAIKDGGWYNSDTARVKETALYLSAILVAAFIVGLAFTDKQKLTLNARSLAYAGVCVAMSYALSFIKLWDLPSGGSVTLASLFPLTLYSYIFGVKKGVFVGFVYGALQAIQDPWIIHPAQFILDYPTAFAAIGLGGLFRSVKGLQKLPQIKFTLGAIVAIGLRFTCHVLSGVFAFSANAEGANPFLFSLGYNVYVFVDAAIVIAVGIAVLSSKSFVRAVDKVTEKHSIENQSNPNDERISAK